MHEFESYSPIRVFRIKRSYLQLATEGSHKIKYKALSKLAHPINVQCSSPVQSYEGEIGESGM